MGADRRPDEAAPTGGLGALGRPLVLTDSIAAVPAGSAGAVVVCGSHGGLSVLPYVRALRPHLVVFNDAGGGLEQAGVAALAPLQADGIAACAVAHHSARIGEAASTFATGVISHANARAEALGATPGRRLRDWLLSAA